MIVNIETNTGGKNSGTDEQRLVLITELKIGYSNQTYFPGDPFEGELKAIFNPYGFTVGSWHTAAFGYIKGDRQWLKEFKAGLRGLGLSIKAVQNVKYNIQERQGESYVSLEVGDVFYRSWKKLETKNVLARTSETVGS